MIGASRESLAGLQESLDSVPAGEFATLSEQLRAAAELLQEQKSLRSVLTDPGVPARSRRGVVTDLFGAAVTPSTLTLLQDAAAARWSHDDDLVAALETLWVNAALLDAVERDELDRVENELFRFGRILEASPELQLALTDPAQSPDRKAALIVDLVGSQASPVTTALLAYTAGHLRGRAPLAAVADLSTLAAEQRGRVVATVQSAVALTEQQQDRLAAALDRLTGRRIRLHVEVIPDVVGGIVVRVGDEVIDGSVATRLEQARRALSA